MNSTSVWWALAGLLWYAAAPSAASLLAMMLTVSAATFAALSSTTVALAVMAVSIMLGFASAPSLPSSAFAAAQFGALAYLLATAARSAGLSSQAGTVFAVVVLALLAVATLQLCRTDREKKSE